MSTIDAFLAQIKSIVNQRNGAALADIIILDIHTLSESARKPYEDLHTELNAHFPPPKNAHLVAKVNATFDQNHLGNFHIPLTQVIVQYFCYLRDFTSDSNLTKAKKIEKLTTQCITALDKGAQAGQDGPSGLMMIPIVLSFSSILRSIAINLDRDPTLAAQGASTGTGGGEDDVLVSFLENTANILRNAFIKVVPRCTHSTIPSPDHLSSGLYLITNSCLKLYAEAGKLRNANTILQAIDRQGPVLAAYPAAQRVTYLYYLGRYLFQHNHFYRALLVLQSAYEQCHTRALSHRKQILIHLIAANICLGRMPAQILLRDQAAHNISKPFIQLANVIKKGDIGAFHALMDYTVKGNETAQWFLSKKILMQLRNRCEIICWRSLIYKAMLHGGFLGSAEEGKQNSMPYVRFSVIMDVAKTSFTRAREAAGLPPLLIVNGYDNGQPFGDSDNNWPDDEDEDEYIDPDFAPDFAPVPEDEEGNDQSASPGVNTNTNTNGHTPTSRRDSQGSQGSNSSRGSSLFADKHSHLNMHPTHLSLASDPTPAQINSILLSLIAQGLLRGFVSHQYPDLLQSRFAIPGVRRPGGESEENGRWVWRDVGFPNIWGILRSSQQGVDGHDGDVWGWITEGSVRRKMAARARAGGGNVVRLSGANMKVFGS